MYDGHEKLGVELVTLRSKAPYFMIKLHLVLDMKINFMI